MDNLAIMQQIGLLKAPPQYFAYFNVKRLIINLIIKRFFVKKIFLK